jgi:hypothetical protein
MGSNAHVKPRILKYLTDHANQIVWVQDIAAATGIAEKSVQAAMYGLAKMHAHIAVVERGHAWSYKTESPAKEPVTEHPRPVGLPGKVRTFRELPGVRSSVRGTFLVIDEEGKLYRATPM